MKAKWTHILMAGALVLPMGVYAQTGSSSGGSGSGDSAPDSRHDTQGKQPGAMGGSTPKSEASPTRGSSTSADTKARGEASSGKGASTSADTKASGSSRSAGTTASDAAITAKVKTQLIKDKDVSAMNVNVDTANGVVTLKGTAKSRAEADKAATLARGVDGVKSVKNELTVSAADTNRSSGASTGAARSSSGDSRSTPSVKKDPDTGSSK